MAALVISDLYKSYHGKPVLSGFSAVIPEGKTTCLMGPSGIGKTTLLRILMGLEQPDCGRFCFTPSASGSGSSGRSTLWRAFSRHADARPAFRASAVFQEDRLCDTLNPVSNIRLANPALAPGRIRTELNALGLSGCLDRPIREFSGGMRRRVAILRALLAEYDLLFLDEPFQGLDPGTRALTIDYTRIHSRGRTVLLVTHDPSDAEKMEAAQILTLKENVI